MNSEANYWNSRGSNFFKYKGEYFYTITPIPHYYKRRKLLLNLIGERLRDKNAVLDYGCGDIYNKLNEHGQFIIFEQTAPVECQGEHWIRRTAGKYIEFGARSGFKLKENLLMTFPAEQWFERRIAPFFTGNILSRAAMIPSAGLMPINRRFSNCSVLFSFRLPLPR